MNIFKFIKKNEFVKHIYKHVISSNNFKEKQLRKMNLPEIDVLLKTSIASTIVYENDPKKMLEETDWLRTIDHQIDEICFSRLHGDKLNYFKKLHEIKYLLINDKTSKRLYISFRGTTNISDILADAQLYPVISSISGRFHTGFYKRAEHVPINYFLNKLVYEDYDLILTGHSLGAAVAAMITIKLLYRPDMTDKYAKKIKFIGYGCPSIADIYFKNDVDARYKENFVFIKNGNDIVVEILNYISYMVYKRKENVNSDTFIKLCNFINDVLKNLTNSQAIDSLCQQMRLIIGPMCRLVIPEYTQFGIQCELTKTNGFKMNRYDFNEQEFFKMFADPGKLIEKVQSHYVTNYFRNLKQDYFQHSIDLINKNRQISLNLNKDLSFEIKTSQDFRPLRIVKGNFNSDIILTLNETPKNIEYLVAIKLILDNNVEIYYNRDINLPCDDGSLKFIFNTSNENIFDFKNNLIKQSFTFQFYSHFDQHPFEMTLRKVEVVNGMKQKQKEIESLPFDLLYLHAAFYFHSLNRMNEQVSNEKFLDIKNQILGLFTQLDDHILKEIWKEKCEGYSYNENDINEMKLLAKSYFDYLQFRDQEKIAEFIRQIDKATFDANLNGFTKQILKTKFNDYGSIKLLLSIIPYLYEIKKRTCDISMMSDDLKNRIFQLSFIQKCQKIGEMGLITLIQTLSGTSVAIVGVVAGAGAGAVLTGAGVGAAAVAVTAVLTEAVAITAADEIGNSLKNVLSDKRYYPSWNQDKVYENIIKNLKSDEKTIKNEINMTLAKYEKLYNQEFIDQWTSRKDHIILKLIILNSKIRDVLCKHILIGAIGTKKAGKSTFVELITNQAANSSMSIGTKLTTAYSILDEKKNLIYDNVIILDYPHSNSQFLDQKLEFIFTRSILDHIYLIFEIKDKGETDEEKNLYKLIASNNFFGLTFVYNKTDWFFDSDDDVRQSFHEFKSDLYENLKVYTDDKVFFSCMKKKGISEITKELKDNNIYLRNDLKKLVLLTIDSLNNGL